MEGARFCSEANDGRRDGVAAASRQEDWEEGGGERVVDLPEKEVRATLRFIRRG